MNDEHKILKNNGKKLYKIRKQVYYILKMSSNDYTRSSLPKASQP